jgi:hypothetical protein
MYRLEIINSIQPLPITASVVITGEGGGERIQGLSNPVMLNAHNR